MSRLSDIFTGARGEGRAALVGLPPRGLPDGRGVRGTGDYVVPLR
jgi:hypothetical protein